MSTVVPSGWAAGRLRGHSHRRPRGIRPAGAFECRPFGGIFVGWALKSDSGGIGAVSLSPDGGLLAAGAPDGTVLIWEAATGRVLPVLKGHAGPVNSVSFASTGRTIASGGADHTIRLSRQRRAPVPRDLPVARVPTRSQTAQTGIPTLGMLAALRPAQSGRTRRPPARPPTAQAQYVRVEAPEFPLSWLPTEPTNVAARRCVRPLRRLEHFLACLYETPAAIPSVSAAGGSLFPVEWAMHCVGAFFHHVGVNLCCGNVPVTEQFLDRANVIASLQ